MDAPHDIVKRHLLIIFTVGQMAEEGVLVGDLVRSTTRHCLISLLAAGVEPAEASDLFARCIREQSSTVAPDRTQMLRIFDSAISHAEYLTLIEENEVR